MKLVPTSVSNSTSGSFSLLHTHCHWSHPRFYQDYNLGFNNFRSQNGLVLLENRTGAEFWEMPHLKMLHTQILGSDLETLQKMNQEINPETWWSDFTEVRIKREAPEPKGKRMWAKLLEVQSQKQTLLNYSLTCSYLTIDTKSILRVGVKTGRRQGKANISAQPRNLYWSPSLKNSEILPLTVAGHQACCALFMSCQAPTHKRLQLKLHQSTLHRPRIVPSCWPGQYPLVAGQERSLRTLSGGEGWESWGILSHHLK